MSESNLPPPLPRSVYHAAAFSMRAAQATEPAFGCRWKLAGEYASGLEYAAGRAGGFWAMPQPSRADYAAAAEFLASRPTTEGTRPDDIHATAAQIARDRARIDARARVQAAKE